MTGSEVQDPDEDLQVRGWLRWLERQPVGCALSKRILFESQLRGGRIGELEIGGWN